MCKREKLCIIIVCVVIHLCLTQCCTVCSPLLILQSLRVRWIEPGLRAFSQESILLNKFDIKGYMDGVPAPHRQISGFATEHYARRVLL